MEDALVTSETALLLKGNWGLETREGLDWESLHVMLKGHLAFMLGNDFAGLVNLMYRMDVSERDFKEAFTLPTMDAVSDRLARVVLARELKRAEMRLRYRESREGDQRV